MKREGGRTGADIECVDAGQHSGRGAGHTFNSCCRAGGEDVRDLVKNRCGAKGRRGMG